MVTSSCRGGWAQPAAVTGPLLALAALLACSGQARAQPASNTTQTTSTSQTQTITPQTVRRQVNTSVTEIIGRLANQAPVYDTTFNAAFSDPQVQAGIAQARAAILAAAGPATPVTGPVLASSLQSTTTTSSTVDTASTSTMISSSFFFGPQTIMVGDLGLCTFGGSNGQPPSGCQTGTPFFVARGTSDLNTNTNTDTQVQRTTTFTDTVQTSATYVLTAGSAPPTTVPEPASLALLGASLAGMLALRRPRQRQR